jgi:hypothetical protein
MPVLFSMLCAFRLYLPGACGASSAELPDFDLIVAQGLAISAYWPRGHPLRAGNVLCLNARLGRYVTIFCWLFVFILPPIVLPRLQDVPSMLRDITFRERLLFNF